MALAFQTFHLKTSRRLVKRRWTFPSSQPKPGVFVSSQTFRCVLISRGKRSIALGIQGFRNRTVFKKFNDTSLCKGRSFLYPHLNPSSVSVSSSLSLGWYLLLHKGFCEKWKRGLARASQGIIVTIIIAVLIIIRMTVVCKLDHLASDASCASH